ncbi:hypothetical protein LPB67_00335 [Undibacterium sp. Jales W-56]|uniref:hypothetical protein n=1 Tax=Undibacterium sp. Jales W-56 TaxID=2897325 RepID=UPI0021CF1CC7|nr:hypothetical protein [Undibacterium sp. Jales W-56]MCU6432221.1 hypothetical protein [Undibacterium sp. Jales W-56]
MILNRTSPIMRRDLRPGSKLSFAFRQKTEFSVDLPADSLIRAGKLTGNIEFAQNDKLLAAVDIEPAGWMRLAEAFRANRRIQLAASF